MTAGLRGTLQGLGNWPESQEPGQGLEGAGRGSAAVKEASRPPRGVGDGSACQENGIQRRTRPPWRRMEGRVSGPAALGPDLQTGVPRRHPVFRRPPPKNDGFFPQEQNLPKEGAANPNQSVTRILNTPFPSQACRLGQPRLCARDPDCPPEAGPRGAPRAPLFLTGVTWLPGAVRGAARCRPGPSRRPDLI